jgi:hypothetical protein
MMIIAMSRTNSLIVSPPKFKKRNVLFDLSSDLLKRVTAIPKLMILRLTARRDT